MANDDILNFPLVSDSEVTQIDEIPPALSDLDRIRRPDIIYSTGYLNDPIEFHPDQEFLPTPIPLQVELDEKIYNRDVAGFLVVKINEEEDAPDKGMYIPAISPVYDRFKYAKYVSKPFTELE